MRFFDTVLEAVQRLIRVLPCFNGRVFQPDSDISDYTYERTLKMEERTKLLRSLNKADRDKDLQTHIEEVVRERKLSKINEEEMASFIPGFLLLNCGLISCQRLTQLSFRFVMLKWKLIDVVYLQPATTAIIYSNDASQELLDQVAMSFCGTRVFVCHILNKLVSFIPWTNSSCRTKLISSCSQNPEV